MVAAPAAALTRTRTRSAWPSRARASSSSTVPTGVSVTPVGERAKSRAPISASNCLTARLSGGWLMCSRVAARPKWSGESEGDAAGGGGTVEGGAVARRIREIELGAVQGQEPQTSPPCAGRVPGGERTGHQAERGLQHVLAEAGAGPAQRRPVHPREGPAARDAAGQHTQHLLVRLPGEQAQGQDEVHDQPRRQEAAPPLGPVVLGYRRVHQLSGEHLRQDPDPHPLARAPPRHTRGNDLRNSKATALTGEGPQRPLSSPTRSRPQGRPRGLRRPPPSPSPSSSASRTGCTRQGLPSRRGGPVPVVVAGCGVPGRSRSGPR